MKQEAILKKIGIILEELNEQHEYLANNAQDFNELELDLFLANANFLADHIQIIKKIAVSQSKPDSLATSPLADEPRAIVNDVFEELPKVEPILLVDNHKSEQDIPSVEFVKHDDQIPDVRQIEEEIFKLDHTSSAFEFILNDHSEHETTTDSAQIENVQFTHNSFIPDENTIIIQEKFEFEEKSVDELFNRPLSGEEERIIAEKKKLNIGLKKIELEDQEEEEEEVGPEPFLVIKEKEIFPIVAEDLTFVTAPIPAEIVESSTLVIDPNHKPTLNELLAGRQNINPTSGDKPSITDLKQGVNLNDKLLYIKDLFNGYNLAYAEAIEIANKLPNFESADNFFQKNYAAKNNWSEKQATVDQFYELLNQRFK